MTLTFTVNCGKNLTVPRDGSEIFSRVAFATFTADSEHVEVKSSAGDYELSISKELNGSGLQFLDQLVRLVS